MTYFETSMGTCAQSVEQGHMNYQTPLSCMPQRAVPNISFPSLTKKPKLAENILCLTVTMNPNRYLKNGGHCLNV